MSSFPPFFIALLALTALALACYVWRAVRLRRRIPASARRQIRQSWEHAASLPDPVRRVMEAEKAADRLLAELGFRGSFAEKLTAAGVRLGDMEPVWRAHKLRNRLAHEPGATASEAEADRALRAFGRLIAPFLEK